MAVRIRLKKLGRTHRPFFRVCAMDGRSPRDGKVIEELGYYDPMVKDADARAILKRERVDYWLGVGAMPTEKVGVLIKKYGTNGTHLDAQAAAIEKLNMKVTFEPPKVEIKEPEPEPAPVAEGESAEGEAAPEGEAPAEATAEASEETTAEAPAEGEAPAEEKSE